jgi:hypothetical protein
VRHHTQALPNKVKTAFVHLASYICVYFIKRTVTRSCTLVAL